MALEAWFKWLAQTSFAIAIHESDAIFPWIESFHVLAITLVVGSIAIVDLRLLGLASKDRAVTRLTGEVLPWTWGAFALAAVTGAALFASNAVNYAHNTYFQGKMLLLLLAGINMLGFHFLAGRDVARWQEQTPLAAKVSAGASLLLWLGVVGLGRWIGFTLLPTLSG